MWDPGDPPPPWVAELLTGAPLRTDWSQNFLHFSILIPGCFGAFGAIDPCVIYSFHFGSHDFTKNSFGHL